MGVCGGFFCYVSPSPAPISSFLDVTQQEKQQFEVLKPGHYDVITIALAPEKL